MVVAVIVVLYGRLIADDNCVRPFCVRSRSVQCVGKGGQGRCCPKPHLCCRLFGFRNCWTLKAHIYIPRSTHSRLPSFRGSTTTPLLQKEHALDQSYLWVIPAASLQQSKSACCHLSTPSRTYWRAQIYRASCGACRKCGLSRTTDSAPRARCPGGHGKSLGNPHATPARLWRQSDRARGVILCQHM